jgi:hypothetical protein
MFLKINKKKPIFNILIRIAKSYKKINYSKHNQYLEFFNKWINLRLWMILKIVQNFFLEKKNYFLFHRKEGR